MAKRITTIVLTIAAVAVVTAIAAVAASAAAPKFESAAGFPALFKLDSGLSTFENNASTERLQCLSDLGHGLLLTPTLGSNVIITLHGCLAINSSGTRCDLLNVGGTPLLIALNPAVIHLGTVKSTEAPSEVGLLFAPETGNKIVTLEASCLSPKETAVTGDIAGEITPVEEGLVLVGNVIFNGGKANQSIKKIFFAGKEEKPELTAFGGVTQSDATNELMLFSTDIEVT